MSVWTFEEIHTGLWLDGADPTTIFNAVSGGSTPANNGAVLRWEDKSGNARHCTQATATHQPKYLTNGLNSLSAISFDGNDFLQGSVGSVSGNYAGPYNIYWVSTRATAGGGTILTERLDTRSRATLFYEVSGSRFISANGVDASANHTIDATTYGLLSTAGAVGCLSGVSGSRDKLFINGEERTVTAGTASNITGLSAGYRVGAREGSTAQYWNGLICEIATVPESQTTAERQLMEGRLAWKWGFQGSLVSGHPYKDSPPTATKFRYSTLDVTDSGFASATLPGVFNAEYSIEAFIDVPTFQRSWVCSANSASGCLLAFLSAGLPRISFGTGAGLKAFTYSKGLWRFVYDDSQTGLDKWRAFRNGVEQAHVSTTGSFAAPDGGTGVVNLGRRTIGFTGTELPLLGRLAQVKIWSRKCLPADSDQTTGLVVDLRQANGNVWKNAARMPNFRIEGGSVVKNANTSHILRAAYSRGIV